MTSPLWVVGKLLLSALLGTTHIATDRGYATAFGGRGDLLAGGSMACTGRPMHKDDLICAHRSLPCGTLVLVHSQRTRRVAACVVADRGPYGATLPSGEIVLKVHPHEEGAWRGLIDLSPKVAEALGLTGRERVDVFYERAPRKRVDRHLAARRAAMLAALR